MASKLDTPDARVAAVASRQHGAVTRRQLEAVGLDSKAITRRARKGQLHRLHRGVYAVGHRAPSWRGRWMAGVLACGEGAVLSHHSAAALWELLKPIDGAIHVSVPTTSGRATRRGIHLHRLPLPETNVKLGRHEVDFLWRESRLIVETDSFRYHRGSIAFEDDYARDLDLRTAGFTVLRFADTQIEEEPDRVAADVAAALGP